MSRRFDILGIGCVAVDDLLYVAEYPAADTKTQVRRRERQCGGLTATALVAAARLGARCAYAGTLGDDDLSRFVIERLKQEGIDVAATRRRAGARPVHSVVIVDESRQTRTILFDLDGFFGAEPDWPAEDVIRSARVLFVDHLGVEGMLRAVRVAHEAGVAVVADFERAPTDRFLELLSQVDHLILSQDFAGKLTDEPRPAGAARRLWTPQRETVVVTCGQQGCWYLTPDHPDQPRHQPAFSIEVVDTTGCGDVFHGAYAAALAGGLDAPARVRFASAAAALKATRRGGQVGIPTRSTVETFLEEHG